MSTNWGSILKAKLLHRRIQYLSLRDWNIRHKTVFRINSNYCKPCDISTETSHLKMWRQLRSDVSLNTLRLCHGISGTLNPEIVPEEVYVSEIEPCLNRYREIAYIENKNFYNRWFPDGIFPTTFIHNIDGEFYDQHYKVLDADELIEIVKTLPYPVVIKPSMGPGGGRGVFFPMTSQELKTFMTGKANFVVQELINQHVMIQRFNSSSLNTFRVCTYRSVKDNKVHILNISMRMGKGGSLDNETAGGIVCGVMVDGKLNSYAVDKYGTKFFKHPDTGKDFSQSELIPYLSDLINLSKKIAQDVYLARLVSLDACLDSNGNWRIIEINLHNQTIRFAQYAGQPFFGGFTQEVINYCVHNQEWR